jgi:SHS family lactate transporter-like MFS transporter
MYGQVPSYLTERFPTEIRGTATGFCYHVGAIPGAMVPPILTFFAVTWDLGFAIPMLIGTLFGLAKFYLVGSVRPGDQGYGHGRRTVGGVTHGLR